MPYVTSIEQIGLEKGEQIGLEKGSLKTARESVIEVLETKFENVPENLTNILDQIKDIQQLKQLHKRAILIESLASFESILFSELNNQN